MTELPQTPVRLARFQWLVACSILLGSSWANAQDVVPIDFDRQIRPILSDRCYFCHGPDSKQRQADLRLDEQKEALAVIDPGSPETSELLRRIASDDPGEIMPPPESKLTVTEDERQLIRQWIAQGAKWQQHWAFEPRQHPTPPAVQHSDQVGNELDRFLLENLESRGLAFSDLASREALIRRVTFDLTGLPPSVAEIDAFLADSSVNAYETLVDRLLTSEDYGQRMASDWLDIARYSDTYGYQVDRDRDVWPWRDWVVRAFNSNQPFDAFLTDQLAGDLIPDATDEQILATTFNRLHPQKVEGGSVEEEFRVEYVADRAQTVSAAFLGLTMECARCHDHKFDPISQKEYYQLFAFFNNIDEAGLYSFFTNSVPTPTMPLLNDAQRGQLANQRRAISDLELSRPSAPPSDETLLTHLKQPVAVEPIERVDFDQIGLGLNEKVTDQQGQIGVKLTGDDEVNLKTGNFTRDQPFSVTLTMFTPNHKERAVVFHRSRAWTDAGSRGYQLLIEDGKLSGSLIHFWPGNAISVRTQSPIPTGRWLQVALVYDGSATAGGLSLFVDGQRQPVEIVRDQLTRNITGGGGDQIAIGARFRDRGFTQGMVSTFEVYDRQLSSLQIAAQSDSGLIENLVQRLATGKLSAEERERIEQDYQFNGNTEWTEYAQKLQVARKNLNQTLDQVSEIMVMREMATPRTSYVLGRGQYDNRLEEVSAATPAVLPPMDANLPRNRLGLAQWMTAENHPLTARVAVNHYWQLIFGDGLVRTPEDFGRQGSRPTNPQLLDWLASDFVDHGWDVKRLIKQLVTSRAYRQSSAASKELLQLDPANLWLARAPSYRLPAEMLRDNVLAASGLLVDRLGGPPAKPYELAASFKPSTPDSGDGLYRRSLYTYWKRTAPAPVMMTLDAAKRDVCRVRRERTSSPLQALAMLNGPQFVEASRALSLRLLEQHGWTDDEAILVDMFRTLTSRRPDAVEQQILMTLLRQQTAHFVEHPAAAGEYLNVGQSFRASVLEAISLPANDHDVRLGVDSAGSSRFQGEFGRASLFNRVLTPTEVRKLAMQSRDWTPEVPTWILSNLGGSFALAQSDAGDTNQDTPVNAGNEDGTRRLPGRGSFRQSSQLPIENGLTMEAWIKPDQVAGRIWDKITPGKGDGFLLDLHGGLRLIFGQKTLMADRVPVASQWNHVAASVDLATGELRLYLNGEPSGEIAPRWTPAQQATLAAWTSLANTLINHDQCVTKR